MWKSISFRSSSVFVRRNSTNNDFPPVLAPVIALLLYFHISSSVDSNYSSHLELRIVRQLNQRMMHGVRMSICLFYYAADERRGNFR